MSKLMVSFCDVYPRGLALGILDFNTAAFRWVDLSNLEVKEKIEGVTGLCLYKNRYFFCTESYKNPMLVTLDKDLNLDKTYRLSETLDPHTLVPFEDGFLVTHTGGNRINRIQLECDNAYSLCESEYWRYSDEQIDRVHVNSVAVVNNEVYVSLFGTKPKEGWDYARAGNIINISKNRIICNNLLHPHSLMAIDGILYWLESGTSKVFRYLETEGCEVVMKLSGYLRGITYDDKYLYIASSAARRQSRSTGTLKVAPSNPDDMCSWIYRIRRDWSRGLEVQRQELTFLGAEIFDLILLDDEIQFDTSSTMDAILLRLSRYDHEYLPELKKAVKDVEILQNINLGHEKVLQEKDAELKKAVKDFETLQNINLRHQKKRIG